MTTLSSAVGLLAAAAFPSPELVNAFLSTHAGDLAVMVVLGIGIGSLSLLNGKRK